MNTPTSGQYFKTLSIHLNVDLKLIYLLPQILSKNTSLRAFQYKVMNNVLFLNHKFFQYRFSTTFLRSYCVRILKKMTLTDELKILDDKIKANQSQYDLGRAAAKISALSSKDLLEKYEYLTGEDLGYRPSVFGKTKFQYSPLGM